MCSSDLFPSHDTRAYSPKKWAQFYKPYGLVTDDTQSPNEGVAQEVTRTPDKEQNDRTLALLAGLKRKNK